MPDEQKGPLPTHFGTLYPTGYVVVVLADEPAAQRASDALQQAGWSHEEVVLLSDKAMLARYQQEQDEQGALAKLAGLFASDERVTQEQYLDLAKRGCWFVFAPVPDRERLPQVAKLLQPIPPVAMHHYGDNVMSEVLTSDVKQEAEI